MAVNAEADLNAPDRPVRLTISHPVLDATRTARTAGDIGGDLTLHVTDMAALVPSVRGALTLDGTSRGAAKRPVANGARPAANLRPAACRPPPFASMCRRKT